MNSNTIYSEQGDKKSASQVNRVNSLEFNLTNQQYIYIQHYLPKLFSLHQHKINKRQKKQGNGKIQNDNISKMSGTFDLSQQKEQKKRNKKKFTGIEEEASKIAKKSSFFSTPLESQKIQKVESIQSGQDMSICNDILNGLKKNDKCYPFLQPVDPKATGAFDYFDIIKSPMDISTIEKKLSNNQYKEYSQFKKDLNQIWQNSYTYNDKLSPVYKYAVDMEKLSKRLQANAIRKAQKLKQTKSQTFQLKSLAGQNSQKNEMQIQIFDKISKSENRSQKDFMNLSIKLKSLSGDGMKQVSDIFGIKDFDLSSSINFSKLDSSQIDRLQCIAKKYSNKKNLQQQECENDNQEDQYQEQNNNQNLDSQF